MEIQIPNKVFTILNMLNENGQEAYIVGGCVRDSIMGRTPKDWDITTSARPEQVKEIFPHTFDTGIAHGTVTVVLDHENFEVTTYRIDGGYTDCRHPDSVAFTDNLTEDLRRRDFTMNAIAYHPERGFCDPFHGREAIQKESIEGVGDPAERFLEDALRMLRAVRFSVQLGFTIEEKTFCAIQEKAPLLKKISTERIREELTKLLQASYVEKLPLLWESGLLAAIHKELAKEAVKHSKLLVAEGKRYAARSSEQRKACICFALLLQILPRGMAEPFLYQLKFDKKTMREILMLLQNEGRVFQKDAIKIRQAAGELGVWGLSLLLEYQAVLGKEETEEAEAIWHQIQQRHEPLLIRDLQIDGRDLMALGIPAGKEIGESLAALLAVVHSDPTKNQKEILTKLAKEKIEKD